VTNTEFFILLGTVLAGVLWQRADTIHLTGRMDNLNRDLTGRIEGINRDLSGRIDAVNRDLTGRIDRISDDLKQFYRTLGEHDKAIDNLEKK
jgi:hypothetical protein